MSLNLSSSTMRPSHPFDKKAEDMKPSKSDTNRLIMDYLISEGYPAAAASFATESNLRCPTTVDSIRERVHIQNSIHAGRIAEAIDLINDVDAEILDHNHLLHFDLLQLQLIEIIRSILENGQARSVEFRPAIEFATEQLAPRAPTDPVYQTALERTMALLIFPPDKMAPEFKELLDVKLRESVATNVNRAILESQGQRPEAKIRQLVRARAWAEAEAREAKISIPSTLEICLNGSGAANGNLRADGDAMIS